MASEAVAETSDADGRVASTSDRESRHGLGGAQLLGIASLLVAIGGLALRAWLYRQPVNSDDIEYFQTAVGNMTTFGAALENAFRIGLLFPIRVLTWAAGSGIEGYYVVVYFNAVLMAVAVYVFARTFSGRRAALVALALWATSVVYMETDTRIVPDNLGISYALFALALLAWLCRRWSELVQPRREAGALWKESGWLLGAAGVAGLLVWASWATRPTFAPLVVVVALSLVWFRARRPVVTAVITGFVAGVIAEFAYGWFVYDDAFARLSLILAQGTPAISASVDSSGIFAGRSYGDLPLRYPRLLSDSQTLELWLHIAGLIGVGLWLARIREVGARVKLATVVASYGLIAFGLTNFDPPVVLMREKLRYYATAAALFHLATADLVIALADRVVMGIRRGADRSSFAGVTTMSRHAGAVVLVPITAGVLWFSQANAEVLVTEAGAARNGNDAFLAAADHIHRHAERTEWGEHVHVDETSARVSSLLLPRSWIVGSGQWDNQVVDRGYLMLVWKRLNGNVRYGYPEGANTYRYVRAIEDYPILFRHRRGAELLDVHLVPDSPIRRRVDDVTDHLMGWQIAPRDGEARPLSETARGIHLTTGDTLFSGQGGITTPSSSPKVRRGWIVQVVFTARSDSRAVVQAQFNWHDHSGEYTRQYMGRTYSTTEARELAFWTYLPRNAADFRVAIGMKDPGELLIEDISVRLLSPHPLDVAAQEGGAW